MVPYSCHDLGGDDMNTHEFPVIDMSATGKNIRSLRLQHGLTVRDVQAYFGFEEPRAVYKWQNGESLPSVDNLYALSRLLETPMDQILVPAPTLSICKYNEQQAKACCSSHFSGHRTAYYFEYNRGQRQLLPFIVRIGQAA